mmetsp:Transcript_34914/g.100473  ORF Transcript_34914/g.100473 Transcript_34914/m.100473 type:complete len:84 (+) Transcript_34914:195-446(+)
MSSTSASAAAAGGEHGNVFGVGNRNGALVDQSVSAVGSTSVAGSLLNALGNLCVLQSRVGMQNRTEKSHSYIIPICRGARVCV